MVTGRDEGEVDEDLLTKTGRGGLFSSGYVSDQPLVEYLESDENPVFVFSNAKSGIVRHHANGSDAREPSSGYRTIVTVTDSRILFVVGGAQDGADWSTSISISDIESVNASSGILKQQLSVTTADGTRWVWYPEDADLEAVEAYIEAAATAWGEVERHLQQARQCLVDATEHKKSREYDAAKDRLAAAREQLTEARAVTTSRDVPASGMESRIERISGQYRETKRRVHTSRATHLIDEAERHWRAERYVPAYDAYVAARAEYELVLAVDGLAATKADRIRDRIASVDRSLEHLRTAPLSDAADLYEQAREADPDAAIDHWETVLDRYHQLISVDWGKSEKRFDVDVETLRQRVAVVVDQLIADCRVAATDAQSRGDEAVAAGELTAAREHYANAGDYLQRARDVAREFDPEAVDDLERRLAELDATIQSVTEDVRNGSLADEE